MKRSVICSVCLSLALAAAPAAAQDDGGEARTLQTARENLPPQLKEGLTQWEDFVHYLRVAQLDLALESGRAFSNLNLPPEQLLTVVDELSMYRDYDDTLQMAQKLKARDEERAQQVGELAAQVAELIKDARLALAREGKRIRRAIEELDDGLRKRLSAQARLKEAGEYAAPELLKVITSTDPADKVLRPYVIEAMVVVGRPLVVPLAEALPHIAAVPKQQVAEILARIGYPVALPYLRAELARDDVDQDTREVLQIAFDRIVGRTGVPRDSSPDTLFLLLGEDYYANRESLVIEPDEPHNLLWYWQNELGLDFVKIPTPVFHDVMSMRAARRALNLNADLSAAMSLWLAANFRRENNLPAGETDASYGPKMRSPHVYGTLAGPDHLHPVLLRALENRDPELARDAIRALASTSGTEKLVNTDGDLQPLVAAMNYPDRRVRFEAAIAIARSVPRVDFPGSQRVVQVLAEAIREQGKFQVVVLGDSVETTNDLSAHAAAAGSVQTIIGNSIEAAAAQIAEAPGVDLVLVKLSAAEAMSTAAAVRNHYKMMAAPILVLAAPEKQPTVKRMLAQYDGVYVSNAEATPDQVGVAIKDALSYATNPTLSDDQALAYATESLDLLLKMAIEGGETFNATDARAALVNALSDPREPVILGAANVLARFSDAEAQQELAEAALNPRAGATVQVALLRALAASARAHGNQLTPIQIESILELIGKASGPLADAAAEAHGALNLPTSNAVQAVSTDAAD